MPAGLVDQEEGVGRRRDSFGDFREVEVHGVGVAGRQDQGRALALVWADRTEDVGGSGVLIAGSARAGAALRPSAGDFVLLTCSALSFVEFDRRETNAVSYVATRHAVG